MRLVAFVLALFLAATARVPAAEPFPAIVEIELPGANPLLFRLVPAGAYVRGSSETEPGRLPNEGPARRVEIDRPFYLMACEMTETQWDAVTGANPSYFRERPGAARFPVEHVTWDDVGEILLPALAPRAPEGWIFRLPTEAEWEYAARAGTTGAFSTGDALGSTQANVDFFEVADSGAWTGAYLKSPAPVASYPPNAWGFHDMHGNVAEWCVDGYDETAYAACPDGAADPRGPANADARVLRGGSWYDEPAYCRSAYRGWSESGVAYCTVGVRLALEPPPASARPSPAAPAPSGRSPPSTPRSE